MPTTLYCSQADLENRLSADGVSLRSDDGPPTSLGDVLDDASRTVDEHCLPRYPRNLAASPWVRQRCTDIAAYLLCERRGNPPPSGVADRYARCLERLEMVRLGRLNIPDIPESCAGVPVLSNVRTVLSPVPHARVERSRSTGPVPSGYTQRVDELDPLDYVI